MVPNYPMFVCTLQMFFKRREDFRFESLFIALKSARGLEEMFSVIVVGYLGVIKLVSAKDETIYFVPANEI